MEYRQIQQGRILSIAVHASGQKQNILGCDFFRPIEPTKGCLPAHHLFYIKVTNLHILFAQNMFLLP
jgi:hypothetical protein